MDTHDHSASASFFGRPVALPLGWLLVALLLILEWSLFVQFFNRELAGGYPTASDQPGYLTRAYETYDSIMDGGLLQGLRYGLLLKLPQGTMLHLQAALLLLVAGPNRFSALSINFVYFALLQCFAVQTLVWLTNRWSVAFLGLGLLLATRSRFMQAGGITDFRLDHIALCLFGIFVCLVIRSNVFACRRWSVVAAIAGALLILFRFQSAVTVASSLGVLLLIFGWMAWRGKNATVRQAALQRARGLLLTGVSISIIILPAIWLARQATLAYYVSQTATDVAIRAREYGAPDALSYWMFYVRSLMFDHLGSMFGALALVILGVLFPAMLLRRPVFNRSTPQALDFRMMLLFLAVMLVVPLAILTIWPIRNPLVANIVVTPAVGLILSAVVAFAGQRKVGSPPLVSRTLIALAASVLACGTLFELEMVTRRTYLTADRESVRNILELYDEITLRSHKMGWSAPKVSFDRVVDYLTGSVESALSFERHGFMIEPRTLLGDTIQPVELAPALQALRDSDFAILTDLSSPETPGFTYPFNTSMKQIEPQLHATAERLLMPVKHFQAFAHGFTLYERPSMQIMGDSGGWMTSEGLTLVAPAETLRVRPTIELSGTTILAEYLGKVTMTARILAGGQELQEFPARFDLPAIPKQRATYKAVIKLDPAKLPAAGEVQVKLSSDRFFVPKDIGFNADTRQLVIMTPQQVRLLP